MQPIIFLSCNGRISNQMEGLGNNSVSIRYFACKMHSSLIRQIFLKKLLNSLCFQMCNLTFVLGHGEQANIRVLTNWQKERAGLVLPLCFISSRCIELVLARLRR